MDLSSGAPKPDCASSSAVQRLAALAVLLSAAAALAWFQVVDEDLFWHLKTGQVILETGRLIRANLFSSTFTDHPWVNPEWLFQVLTAAVFNNFGWSGVAIAKILVTAAIAGVLFTTLLVTKYDPALAAALALCAMVVMRLRLTERPHLLSYFFFAVVIAVLARARRGARHAPWVLPPLFSLWSNIHPELLLGLLLIAGMLVGDAVDRLRGGSRAQNESTKPLLWAFLLCLPATLANPESWRVLVFPFLHLRLGPVIDVVEYRSSFGFPVPLFWAALSLTAVVLWRCRRTLTAAEVLPLGGLGLLAVLYLRSIPYFALVAAPVVYRQLACAAPDATTGPVSGPPSRPLLRRAALLLGPAMCLVSLMSEQRELLRWGFGVNARQLPVAAANLMAAEPLPGRLYNEYGTGGYLIFRLWPRVGVFQDGRFQAYPRSFFALLNRDHTPEEWQAILVDQKVNTALVSLGGSRRLGFERREWGIVFWDDSWRLLVRRTPEAAALLERLEYRRYLPDAELASAVEREPEALLEELSRNQSGRSQPSALVTNDRGIVLASIGRLAEALDVFREAVAIDPKCVPAWENLGQAFQMSGDAERARTAWERALQLDSTLVRAREGLASLGPPPPR